MSAADPFNLERFVAAQQPVFATALAELQAGRKRTHWMWFIFPQLRGLGRSATAIFYGIASLDEARAYLAHKLLGPKLERCTNAVLGVEGRSLHEIFGSPDDMKFHSSMTLFAVAAYGAAGEAASPYRDALDRWCQGTLDPQTLRLLGREDEVPSR
jgi:uncharacterized protein (DUF1810 family)